MCRRTNKVCIFTKIKLFRYFRLVITAVSPNVVVNVLFKLKEKRLGLNKGIQTLIIAVASCNNIISIFLFGVAIGIAFSTGTVQNSN